MDKLRGLISRIEATGELHDFQVELLCLYTRQYLEMSCTARNVPNLSFMCDLVVHTNLTYNHHFKVLTEAARLFRNDADDTFYRNTLIEIMNFRTALLELQKLFAESAIDEFLITNHSAYRSLILNLFGTIKGREITCRNKIYDEYGDLDRIELGGLKVGNELFDVVSISVESRKTKSGLNMYQCRAKTIARMNDRMDGKGRISFIWNLLPGRCELCQSDDCEKVDDHRVLCRGCGTVHDIQIKART